MKYYFFPLDIADINTPTKHGYMYIKEHRDKLVECADLGNEINTYDRGTTTIVYNGTVYSIHKDFVDISNHERIWLGIPKRTGSDNNLSNF
jgi:hypothetical protein